MAKTTKPGKRELDSYTIRGTNNKVVKVGEAVLMRASDNDTPPYVALIENIEADNRKNITVKVRWYYRPEESTGGRKQFHGSKELFLSDHYDIQSADTIEETCVVHSLADYTKLDKIGDEDYYCRFEYKSATGAFNPDRVVVYCKCEMPYNPDDLMVQCDGCRDWYHPACVNLTIEDTKLLDNFMCAECAAADHTMKSEHSSPSSTVSNGKVETKRRKK